MRVALLHTRLSGYLAACLREFKQQTEAELLIYAWPNQPDSPFDTSTFSDLGTIINRYECNIESILHQILAFRPTAVLASGWRDKDYVRICRHLKSKGIPIIAGCDTQWKGSLRQQIAVWLSPLYLQRFLDVLWVTGERQRHLAQELGYSGDRCWDGYYACDWPAFANSVTNPTDLNHPYFLYVGRYAPEKGIDLLADAFKNYSSNVENPWRLVCAGAGPLQDMLIAAGAEDRGFIQPHNLPILMQGASAFVLPSRFEPWGVVIQEAAACGLPLILSDACGAGVHLLKQYYNGYSFPSGSVNQLTEALMSIHLLNPKQQVAYRQASHELSKQYTPQRWVDTLLHGLKKL
ncbi:glycosyltransferase family 4 protein [Acaryochloris marina S15]|nr:glycosyltransferase family 4 protein [Acaryochloris marina S15]